MMKGTENGMAEKSCRPPFKLLHAVPNITEAFENCISALRSDRNTFVQPCGGGGGGVGRRRRCGA